MPGLDCDENTIECRTCGELYEARPEDCDEYGGPGCPHCEKRQTLKLHAGEHPAVYPSDMLWQAIRSGDLRTAQKVLDGVKAGVWS